MNRRVAVLLAVVTLDAAGTGLVLPLIPGLLREVMHTDDLGWHFGAFLSIYALLQFVCAPVLGALSDRYGRRPVLLLSMAGSVLNYVFMVVAPTFAWLLVGRALAGMTAANASVAAASLTDITPPSARARHFGYLSACFGVGFIVGPVIGGLLGDAWVRAPFVAAAALTAINLAAAFVFLKETRTADVAPFDPAVLDPFEPLRWAFRFRPLLPLLAAFTVLALVGEVGGTIWVVYGQDRFAWNGVTVGLSLAGFGVFHALAQAFVAGPISERFGERAAVWLGIACDTAAYVAMALITRGWMPFLPFPLFCIGGIGAPALQSLLSRRADADHQGRLQGVLTSLTSLATIIGPLVITQVYFASRATFPGLVWVLGACLYLLCLPLLFGKLGTRPDRSEAAAG